MEHAISSPADVAIARANARRLAGQEGLAAPAIEELAIAVSELGMNLLHHTCGGSIHVDVVVDTPSRCGIRVESHDTGPGIADVDTAMRDGYSTRGGYGNGLPAVRRLMDDFDLTTSPNGTTIVAVKWAARS